MNNRISVAALLLSISLIATTCLWLISVAMSSGCCRDFISYNSSLIAIQLITSVLAIYLVKKQEGYCYIILASFVISYLVHAHFYITGTAEMVYSYGPIMLLIAAMYYYGLYLLMTVNNKKTTGVTVKILLGITILATLTSIFGRDFYLNWKRKEAGKALLPVVNDIYLPANVSPDDFVVKQEYDGYLGRFFYARAESYTGTCPEIDYQVMSKNGWQKADPIDTVAPGDRFGYYEKFLKSGNKVAYGCREDNRFYITINDKY